MGSIWRLRVENGNLDGMDSAEVRRALGLLVDPEHHVQYQVLPSAQWINLPGADHDAALSWLAGHSGGQGVYWSLNPLPKLDRPCRNEDPLRRRWLLVDLDAKRQKGTNSSDAEHDAAAELARCILDDLCDAGWPFPVLIDSGNGWHLLWRVDLPNDAASARLLRACLLELRRRYNTESIEIDKAVHDARRISKLPGTWSRKGPHSEERPHRLARIVQAPETVEVVSQEQLQALADGHEEAPAEPSAPATGEPRSALTVRAGASAADAETRAIRYLEKTAPAISGQYGHNALMWAARVVVYGFDLGPGRGLELLRQHYNPRCDPPWSDRELQHKVEDADSKPFPRPRGWLKDRPDRSAGAVVPPPGEDPDTDEWEVTLDGEILAAGSPSEVIGMAGDLSDLDDIGRRQFTMLSMGALEQIEFPSPVWAIPGIMSEGLNILAGAPKQGKSMLALNLALTLAGGGTALGNIRVSAQDVLYLSLEDQHRRVKERARRMLRGLADVGQRSEVNRRLVVATDWPRADRGAFHLLDMWYRRVDRPGMVIVDVWNRLAPEQKPSASAYHQDADAMALLKRYADKRRLTVLVIHHTRKSGITKEPDDFVQEISGTLGLAGTADGIMVLLRSRGETKANLRITGRDCTDQDLVLEFSGETLVWSCKGTHDEHIRGAVQSAVVGYLRAIQPAAAWPRDIAEAIEHDRNSVVQACGRLHREKIIRRIGNGAYAFPGDDDGAI